MSFTIIDTEQTQTQPTETQAAPEQQTKETTTDVSTTADAAAVTVPDQASVADGANGDAGGKESEGVPPEGEGDSAENSEPVEYFYGGQVVEIEIPQDVEESLKAAGLDAKQVAAELYGKEGKFELSPETREKLDKAFGKFAVDAYLSGLKAQNEMFLMTAENEAKEREAADSQRFVDCAAECGGEEGWTRLEEWALANISDQELEAFNAVMASGNQYLQQYAIRELEGRRKAAQGDDEVKLIQPTEASKSTDDDNSPLSAAQYIREVSMLGQKFGRDRKAAAEYQAKLDARRRAGMAKGL